MDVEKKLLRRPRPAKLKKIDLSKVTEPAYDSLATFDEENNTLNGGDDDSSDVSSSLRNTDREQVDPGFYLRSSFNSKSQMVRFQMIDSEDENDNDNEDEYADNIVKALTTTNTTTTAADAAAATTTTARTKSPPQNNLLTATIDGLRLQNREKFINIPHNTPSFKRNYCNTTTACSSALNHNEKCACCGNEEFESPRARNNSLRTPLTRSIRNEIKQQLQRKPPSKLVPVAKASVILDAKITSLSKSTKSNNPTTVADTFELKNQINCVKPYKPLGPDPLPIRPVRHNSHQLIKVATTTENNQNFHHHHNNPDLPTNEARLQQEQFKLNDFLRHHHRENSNNSESSPKSSFLNNNLERSVVSNRTYRQMIKLIEAKIREEKAAATNKSNGSSKVHVQTLVPDIEPFENRKPFRQALIEMANYFKTELSQTMTDGVLKTKFSKTAKWHPEGPKTELLIYQETSDYEENDYYYTRSVNGSKHFPGQQQILASATKRDETAMSSNRGGDDEITPAHLAIIDCLLRDGIALDLKGYFISKLPDISSLNKSLIYINLSFNNFQSFPDELLDLEKLEAIKLRNNPIKSLPESISRLKFLKILTLSYCQLECLPDTLYDLENLLHLDVSYNRLADIDEKIVGLKNLKTLNYEGNELQYLPSSMLKMTKSLKQINVKNNYLHPLLWSELMRKTPVPKLFALTAARFLKLFDIERKSSEMFYKLPFEIQKILKNTTSLCDCCQSKRFTSDLKVIRPCVKVFGVKFLPFVFHCCSIDCYNTMKRKPLKSFTINTKLAIQ